jgi:hypothetical protein
LRPRRRPRGLMYARWWGECGNREARRGFGLASSLLPPRFYLGEGKR